MAVKPFTGLLQDSPENWGRWGANDEIDWLTDLADDCAKDGQYTFLFVGAPLKVVGGAGSPVNPIVIK